ncbi:MAG: DUF4347 domain-containing protein [Planktothrix sp. GU0601_MAG3]|nr:MAG: DUF4347 domain-containing protein [Planktothrix sp. GU0601_MAG3]
MTNRNAKTLNSTPTIVFIDAGVDNAQQLLQGVIPNAKVFILDKTADGIEQISQVLGRYQNIDAVHIISHGAPGCLSLGNTQLSLDTLIHYTPQLQQWNVSNLLLYGCNVATGDAGEEFITQLQALTGSEIAASKSVTGSAAKGGNWELEVTTGQAKLTAAFTSEVMTNYQGIFPDPVLVKDNNSPTNIALSPSGINENVPANSNIGTSGFYLPVSRWHRPNSIKRFSLR